MTRHCLRLLIEMRRVHAQIPIRLITNTLGPVDNQHVQMKEAESATNDEKRSDSLSYRVATRRNCLMRQKNRSTRFREAYRCSSNGRCSRRLARLGMMA